MQLNRHGYVLKKSFTTRLIHLFDLCGSALFRYAKQSDLNPKRIAVLRLDHIGDVVAADAFISQLHRQHPNAEIYFVTSPAGSKVFMNRTTAMCGPIHEMIDVQVSWFQSNSSIFSIWSSFFKLKNALSKINADHVIDLRGDVRHILAARMALPSAYIRSFGITGGKFLLNECVVPDLNTHAIMRNMSFLKHPANCGEVHLSERLASQPLQAGVFTPQSDKTYIVIHPSAGTLAKRWSAERWAELVGLLLKHPRYEVVWVGDSSCESVYQEVDKSMGVHFFERSTNLIGQIPLESLGTLLAMCQVLVSPDSGPVHIAAAQHVPTVVLFSGTSLPEEWTPWETEFQILHRPVPCSPCYRTVCNQPRHHCMLDILPTEVFDAIEDLTMRE